MEPIIASSGNWIYYLDYANNNYWCENTYRGLKERMEWCRPNSIDHLVENIKNLTICKGRYRFWPVTKYLQRFYPEYLL